MRMFYISILFRIGLFPGFIYDLCNVPFLCCHVIGPYMVVRCANHLYHGEKKLIFNKMITRSLCTRPTRLVGFFKVLVQRVIVV